MIRLIFSRKIYWFAIVLSMISLSALISSCNMKSHNMQLLRSPDILVFAPHPDDEILGFAGVIYEAIRSGKNVKVIIVTNGEGYRSAAYLWKNGCPKGEAACSGSELTGDELEAFGEVRIQESRRALSLLGLQMSNVSFLGYPDGRLGQMFNDLRIVVQGNTARSLTHTGKQFTGESLLADIKSMLRSSPNATIFVTHILDRHIDHSALAKFVQSARAELRSENLSFETYWSVIHDPDHQTDNFWPLPTCNWRARRGEVLRTREERYKPNAELQPPGVSGGIRMFIHQLRAGLSSERKPSKIITETPLRFRMKENLWSPTAGNPPLMRKAIDTFGTQIGMIRSNGDPLMPGYEGWVDFSGYLISFVKRNHLFWKAPSPEQPSFQKDPGERSKSSL